MAHKYPRTERDLRALAVNFSAGNIKRGLPERLECLAAYHRTVVEAEKASDGQPNTYDVADREYAASIDRLRAAGIGFSEGEFTYSPCMGPDLAPLPGIASPRVLANRAGVYAAQLRQLAGDIEQAALRPADWRARGILDADRGETVAAGERLREAIAAHHAGAGEPAAWASATRADTVTMQLAANLSSKATPSAIRGWAERWEAWAGEVDP